MRCVPKRVIYHGWTQQIVGQARTASADEDNTVEFNQHWGMSVFSLRVTAEFCDPRAGCLVVLDKLVYYDGACT